MPTTLSKTCIQTFLVLAGVDCEAASIRGDLRHSWYENRVRNLNATAIRADPGARAAFEAKIQPGGMFDESLEQTRVMSSTGADDFSPARLVELSPLRELPDDAKELIRTAVHSAYMERTDIHAKLQRVCVEADRTEEALGDLRKTWASGEQVESGLARFQGAAAGLYDALGELPDGVVIP